MVKKQVLGKRAVSEIEDDEFDIIRKLKDNNNFLKNELTKCKQENQELKEDYENVIKYSKFVLYSSITINLIGIILFYKLK
jgi:hypothetical protein